MNHVLSLVRAARTSSDPSPGLYSDHMLAELLALHEEMIAQLRHERLNVPGDVSFIAGMIEQHERAAAQLGLQLENYGAASA